MDLPAPDGRAASAARPAADAARDGSRASEEGRMSHQREDDDETACSTTSTTASTSTTTPRPGGGTGSSSGVDHPCRVRVLLHRYWHYGECRSRTAVDAERRRPTPAHACWADRRPRAWTRRPCSRLHGRRRGDDRRHGAGSSWRTASVPRRGRQRQVGPNLTDDYWIHVKELTDISEIITRRRRRQGDARLGRTGSTETQIVLLRLRVDAARHRSPTGKAARGRQGRGWERTIPPAAQSLSRTPAEAASTGIALRLDDKPRA